jgi:LPXTG-motif cell wall-anchored protein
MKKISTIAVSLGLVASVAVATPALAAAYDGEPFTLGNVLNRGLSYDDFYVDDTYPSSAWLTANPQFEYDPLDEEWEGMNANWDEVGSLAVDDVEFGEGVDSINCDKVDDGSDVVVTCPEETLSGLAVHPEIRYYNTEMMSRVVWFFENTSGADITVAVNTSFNSECDGSGFMTTSAGDTGTDWTSWDMDASTWSVQHGRTIDPDDGDNEICGIETAAWQGPDASVTASTTVDTDSDSLLDGQDMDYDLTVKAGQTIALAYFFGNAWVSDGGVDPNTLNSTYTVNRSAAFTAAVTAAGTTFGSWNDTLSKGLASDLYVANWQAAPALANTGVDAGAVSFAATSAAAVALLGLGLMVARRRRAQA